MAAARSGHQGRSRASRTTAAMWPRILTRRGRDGTSVQVRGAGAFGSQRQRLEGQSRLLESLGYQALYLPDHFGDQLGPIAALMAAADATTTLRMGSLVFDNDYRPPALLAKEVASLDLLSD